MSFRPAPPTMVERWLARWLPSTEREFILGDLAEEFNRRVAEGGVGRARLWYLIESLGTAIRMSRFPAPARSARPSGDTRMRRLLQDVRFGFRVLARRPLFTLTAVGTLALGIGATTAVFSVVNPVLLASLPYPQGDRVAMVKQADADGRAGRMGYATFADFRRDNHTLETLAAVSSWMPVLTGGAEPERLGGESVSAEFFRVLGVHPALGRDFRAEEDAQGNNRVVILSHGLWQRRFGGDSGLLGRDIQLGARRYTVVGVLPEAFESLINPSVEIWRPLGYDVSLPYACRTCQHLLVVARTKPQVTARDAEQDLDRLIKTYATAYPTEYARPAAVVTPLQDDIANPVRPALYLVLGAAVFVLLIAAANVANLMLGQATRREQEFAIRAALGAGRRSLVRQMLVESLLVSGLGCGLGLAIAWVGVRSLIAAAPAGIPRLDAVGLSVPVLGFSFGVALLCALVLGLVPALGLGRSDVVTRLREGSRGGAGPGRHRLRIGLVVGEVAMALMLMAGAGLLLRSVRNLLGQDPGLDPDHLLTMQVSLAGPAYPDDASVHATYDRLIAAVGAVPGVTSVALASQIPLGGNQDSYGLRIEDQPLANPEEAPSGDRYAVSADYLSTMGIPVIRGRGLLPSDREAAEPVVVINDAFARLAWPGGDPIGKRLQMGGPQAPWRRIVGIAGNVHHVSLDAPQGPQFYVPLEQWLFADTFLSLVVRARSAPAPLTAAVRQAVWSVDKDAPITQIALMRDLVTGSATNRRFAMLLFELFAITAALLAAVGIYGVLAGSVEERTREIGIRAALGADRRRLLRLVVGQGMTAAAFGLLLGAAGALGLGHLLQSLLFGVGPRDMPTLGATALVLAAVALGACLAPAWRAAGVDPIRALRAD